jgi:hypothetical protein
MITFAAAWPSAMFRCVEGGLPDAAASFFLQLLFDCCSKKGQRNHLRGFTKMMQSVGFQ